jgi:hypothetical protein
LPPGERRAGRETAGQPVGGRTLRTVSEPKTTPTSASVADFLAGIADSRRRADATALRTLFEAATGVEPVMWGPSIVGFGRYRYVYASGREGEWPAASFSPRAKNLVIYISHDFDTYDDLMARLGPHTTSKACIYVNRLADVDTDVLRALVRDAFAHSNGRTLTSE